MKPDGNLREGRAMSAKESGDRDEAARIREGVDAFFKRHPQALGAGIVVAYSGGADSTVLLAALASLKPGMIRAVHVSHGLRPADELRAERAIVEGTCRGLKLPLTIATIMPGKIERLAREKEIGIEAAARELRYRILVATARRFGLTTICTAHNANDQLETLLARFISSSSAEGLTGISPMRRLGKGLLLARPLLFASREEIERFAQAEGLRYSTDSTNAENRYMRNRIRHELIPLLDREFLGWQSGALGSAEKLKADRRAMRLLLKRALGECGFAKGQRGAAFDLAGFLAQPEALKVRILTRAASAAGIEGRLSYRALRNAADALAGGAGAVDMAGACLRLRGKSVEILPILDFPHEDKYFFQIPSAGLYRCGPLSLEARWEPFDGDANPSPEGSPEREAFLFEGAFSFPLLVRSRKPGDSMLCSGGLRRLDDILSSWRLEPRDRDLVPIVEDGEGIVAILVGALARPLSGAAGKRRDKFRDYGGDKSGRRLFIRIKGA